MKRIMSGSIYICDKIAASGWLEATEPQQQNHPHRVYVLIGVSPRLLLYAAPDRKHIGKREDQHIVGTFAVFFLSFSIFARFFLLGLFIFNFTFFIVRFIAFVCMRIFIDAVKCSRILIRCWRTNVYEISV